MGYLSCNAESALATCDSYNWDGRKNKHTGDPNPLKHGSTKKPTQIRRFSCAELESATDGFSADSFLGRGSHGCVYRAVLDGGNLVAAVKKTTTCTSTIICAARNNNNHNNNNPEENEIEILSRVRNTRLVNLLGFTADSGKDQRKWIVVEFMPNGSLFDLIHSNPRLPGWTERFRLALQISRAVESLHGSNPPVIHRDIKSSNVLLDHRCNARLGDFGLALRGHVEDVRVRCTPPAGTLGYLDPCYLSPGDISTKSDVFSFGILLLELLSGRNAIDFNFSPPSVVDWAVPLIRRGDFVSICDSRVGPPADLSSIRNVAVLAARCVRSTADKRPPMSEVVCCLKVAYKRVGSTGWRSLRRRVGCLSESSPVIVIDAVLKSEETVNASGLGGGGGGRWNRKVSCVPTSECKSVSIAAVDNRISPSRSIGSATASEMKSVGSDNNHNQDGKFVRRKAGLLVKMPMVVGLSKSRSLGVLQSRRMAHCNNEEVSFQLLRTANPEEMELRRFLVSLNEEPNKGVVDENDELPLIDRISEQEAA